MTLGEYAMCGAAVTIMAAIGAGQWLQSWAELERFRMGCWSYHEKGKAQLRLVDDGQYRIPTVDIRRRIVQTSKVSQPAWVVRNAPVPRPQGVEEPTP